MSDFFLGGVRMLYIKVSGIYKPIACLLSNPMTEGVDMLPTTTRASGGWKTAIPTNQFYSVQFQGIQVLSTELDAGGKLSYDYLKELKRSRSLVEWKIDSPNDNFTDEGTGYIISIGESNDIGEYLTFEGEIQGFGVPVFTRGSVTGDLWMDGNSIIFQNGNNMIFN